MQNYESATKHYPALRSGTEGYNDLVVEITSGRSGFIALLPYIEQSAAHESDRKPRVGPEGTIAAAAPFQARPLVGNTHPGCFQIPQLVCPSEPMRRGDNEIGYTNYA